MNVSDLLVRIKICTFGFSIIPSSTQDVINIVTNGYTVYVNGTVITEESIGDQTRHGHQTRALLLFANEM